MDYKTVELPDVITISKDNLMICAKDAEADMMSFALNIMTLMEKPNKQSEHWFDQHGAKHTTQNTADTLISSPEGFKIMHSMDDCKDSECAACESHRSKTPNNG